MEDKIFIPAPPKELKQNIQQTEPIETKIAAENKPAEVLTETKTTSKQDKKRKQLYVLDQIINWSGLLISFGLFCLFVFYLIR